MAEARRKPEAAAAQAALKGAAAALVALAKVRPDLKTFLTAPEPLTAGRWGLASGGGGSR